MCVKCRSHVQDSSSSEKCMENHWHTAWNMWIWHGCSILWAGILDRASAVQDAEQGAEHLLQWIWIGSHPPKKKHCWKIHNCSYYRTSSLAAPQVLLDLQLCDSTAVSEFPHSKYCAWEHSKCHISHWRTEHSMSIINLGLSTAQCNFWC